MHNRVVVDCPIMGLALNIARPLYRQPLPGDSRFQFVVYMAPWLHIGANMQHVLPGLLLFHCFTRTTHRRTLAVSHHGPGPLSPLPGRRWVGHYIASNSPRPWLRLYYAATRPGFALAPGLHHYSRQDVATRSFTRWAESRGPVLIFRRG